MTIRKLLLTTYFVCLFCCFGQAQTCINQQPVAEAGQDQTVQSGSTVTLDGSASYDPNQDPISYSWTQPGGTPVSLNDPTAVKPSFIAPLAPETYTLTFQLVVTDSPKCAGAPLSASATVTITVEPSNHPPVAVAGSDGGAMHIAGSTVTLDGLGSHDQDGDPITYSWTQLTGAPVALVNSTSAKPQFVAPQVPPLTSQVLTFQLVVTDSHGASSGPAEVNIIVYDPYAPPDCSHAIASLSRIWPPDHKLIGPLTINNVTDPGAPGLLTISISGIFQDEPTQGLGTGDAYPDALINPDGSFYLREERDGSGDGRVYHVSFTAKNAYGGSCTSSSPVVCVPHDPGQGSTCIDGGALYDSTR